MRGWEGGNEEIRGGREEGRWEGRAKERVGEG